MLGFVVPFKSRKKSKDWQKDSSLLRQTLKSLLNQVDPQFRCYVVYTDMPLEPPQDDRIKWVRFPFAFLELEDIADKDTFIRKHNAQKNAELFYDQGKRVLYGSRFAKEDGCDYLMMFDADDLVSNRLSQFVNGFEKTGHVGWYVDKGYIYRAGKLFLQKVPRGMNQMHGSVNIVRSDLVPTPDFSDTRLESYVFFAHHTYLWNLMEARHGRPLLPVPFYATVYVVHDTGWSTMFRDLQQKKLRTLLKQVFRARYMGNKIKKEFGFAG